MADPVAAGKGLLSNAWTVAKYAVPTILVGVALTSGAAAAFEPVKQVAVWMGNNGADVLKAGAGKLAGMNLG